MTSTASTATTVTLRGNPVKLTGPLPKVGSTAPAFSVVGVDMKDRSLSDYKGKTKVNHNAFEPYLSCLVH